MPSHQQSKVTILDVLKYAGSVSINGEASSLFSGKVKVSDENYICFSAFLKEIENDILKQNIDFSKFKEMYDYEVREFLQKKVEEAINNFTKKHNIDYESLKGSKVMLIDRRNFHDENGLYAIQYALKLNGYEIGIKKVKDPLIEHTTIIKESYTDRVIIPIKYHGKRLDEKSCLDYFKKAEFKGDSALEKEIRNKLQAKQR